MALPYFDPRKQWWTLMGGGQGAPIPDRFGQAAWEQAAQKDERPGPDYEFFDEESGGWSADKNNAAINAAMARQASRPWQSNIMSPGAKASMTQGTQAAMAGSAGSSKWKKVIEQLGKMTGPKPDWGLAGQRVGPASAWAHTNIPYNPTAGLMGFRKKKEGPY